MFPTAQPLSKSQVFGCLVISLHVPSQSVHCDPTVRDAVSPPRVTKKHLSHPQQRHGFPAIIQLPPRRRRTVDYPLANTHDPPPHSKLQHPMSVSTATKNRQTFIHSINSAKNPCHPRAQLGFPLSPSETVTALCMPPFSVPVGRSSACTSSSPSRREVQSSRQARRTSALQSRRITLRHCITRPSQSASQTQKLRNHPLHLHLDARAALAGVALGLVLTKKPFPTPDSKVCILLCIEWISYLPYGPPQPPASSRSNTRTRAQTCARPMLPAMSPYTRRAI